MGVQLDGVVPFGRSLDEYRLMFNLTPEDLERPILGVADGPASFNAEMRVLGKTVISLDPLYDLPGEVIAERFEAVVDDIIDQVKATPGDWVWSYHRSPENLRANRRTALAHFLRDYPQGKAAGRYVVGALPDLDFADHRFSLAVCSHFLFLYSDRFTYEFHRSSLGSMLRVADEVRIFPLLTLSLAVSPYLQPLMQELTAQGWRVTIEPVGYELQRGAHRMLRIQQP